MKKTFMGLILAAFLFACNNEKKDANVTEPATVKSSTDTKPSTEILDMSSADIVKRSFTAFSKGDVDGMVADYADTVRYLWSGLDSIIGKQAVVDYWKKRWAIIDSASFLENIYLPINMSEAQSKYAPTGKWILHWTLVDVKYKNGKKLNFWAHYVNHLNADGKIDLVGAYVDRAPIMEATKGLMK